MDVLDYIRSRVLHRLLLRFWLDRLQKLVLKAGWPIGFNLSKLRMLLRLSVLLCGHIYGLEVIALRVVLVSPRQFYLGLHITYKVVLLRMCWETIINYYVYVL